MRQVHITPGIKLAATIALASMTSLSANAADITVTTTNLTHNIYFSPLLIAAHTPTINAFSLGNKATAELQALAEGGDLKPLATMLKASGAQTVENPNNGMLPPGASNTAMLMTNASNTVLSFASMLVPTNDGFAGLDSWMIPTQPGTYTVYLNAYDAGTEANTELLNPGVGGTPGVAGIPGDPTKKAVSGGTGMVANTPNDQEPNVVHIHPGNVGVVDPASVAVRKSDLDSRFHRWLNPVIKLVITVK